MATEICHAVHPVGFIDNGHETGDMAALDRPFELNDELSESLLIDAMLDGPAALMFYPPHSLPGRLAWGGIR